MGPSSQAIFSHMWNVIEFDPCENFCSDRLIKYEWEKKERFNIFEFWWKIIRQTCMSLARMYFSQFAAISCLCPNIGYSHFKTRQELNTYPLQYPPRKYGLAPFWYKDRLPMHRYSPYTDKTVRDSLILIFIVGSFMLVRRHLILWETRARLSYTPLFNTVACDGMVTQRGRVSPTMVLADFPRIVQFQHHKGKSSNIEVKITTINIT